MACSCHGFLVQDKPTSIYTAASTHRSAPRTAPLCTACTQLCMYKKGLKRQCSENPLQQANSLPQLQLALCTLLQEHCATASPLQDLGGCNRTSCQAESSDQCPQASCATSSTEESHTGPTNHLGSFLLQLQNMHVVVHSFLVGAQLLMFIELMDCILNRLV